MKQHTQQCSNFGPLLNTFISIPNFGRHNFILKLYLGSGWCLVFWGDEDGEAEDDDQELYRGGCCEDLELVVEHEEVAEIVEQVRTGWMAEILFM